MKPMQKPGSQPMLVVVPKMASPSDWQFLRQRVDAEIVTAANLLQHESNFIIFIRPWSQETVKSLSHSNQAQELSKLLTSDVIFYPDNHELAPSARFFLNEMGISHIFHGPQQENALCAFLQAQACALQEVGSLSHYQHEAYLLLRAKAQEKARKLIQHAAKLFLDKQARHFFVKAYYHLGDYTKAQSLLRKNLKADPDDLWSAGMLAKLYWQDQNYPYALEMHERLSSYHQLLPSRQLALSKLYTACEQDSLAEKHRQFSKHHWQNLDAIGAGLDLKKG